MVDKYEILVKNIRESCKTLSDEQTHDQDRGSFGSSLFHWVLILMLQS